MPNHTSGLERTKSFGEDYKVGKFERLGIWLSDRQMRRQLGPLKGAAIGDFGCGYNAMFVRRLLDEVAHATVVDVTLADDLKADPRVTAVEGVLPDALRSIASASLDRIICNNVLEHLSAPEQVLQEIRRILEPGGVLFANVPSWRGKYFLEMAAFRLNLTSKIEIDEHKRYYDEREFWTLLVSSGFKPSLISCRSHKFGLNTYAVCRKVSGTDT